MIPKPAQCRGCVLHGASPAHVPGTGPFSSSLYFLGESAGKNEENSGLPFVGDSGGVLNRALKLARRVDREEVRIGNVLWCRPPGNELRESPYEQQAIQTCAARYTNADIETWVNTPSASGRKVMVALGGVPLMRSLGLSRGKGVRVQDFHRSCQLDPSGRFWVVPSYHPSFIQRGAWNLLGVLALDLRFACDVASGEIDPAPDQVELIVDPTPAWFGRYVDAYLAALEEDDATWLAIDIETLDKLSKSDEGELTLLDRDFTILRINFAFSTEQGVTVPAKPEYLYHIRRACASRGIKVFWHARYDVPRMTYREIPVAGPIFDAMWMVHVLHSDLPRGLGFWAPYYSKLQPWKHWHGEDFGRYSATDGVQELRIGIGAARELVERGQWDVFYRHVYKLDELALLPAEAVGLLVDEGEIDKLEAKLDAEEERIMALVQSCVPLELHPLTGGARNTGLTREPELTGEKFPIVHQVVELPVQCCMSCNATQVSKTHRCADRALGPNIAIAQRKVDRWFRREPFNPDSPVQVMKYILSRGHKPGKDKKTKKPSTGKDTLERLHKTTKDPFYSLVLDRRAVTKVNRTYVKSTKRKLAEDPRSRVDRRLHPTFLHKPSTLRLSCQSPNLQNVVADRGARTSLAAGFRRCLISAPGSVLIEADFAGIEAILTGWFMGDPDYMRLGKLGVHGYVAAKRLGIEAELSWDDAKLGAVLQSVKDDHKKPYDKAKRCVHGSNYGLTHYGLHNTYNDLFPTLKSAQDELAFYYGIAPKLPAWHADIRDRAHQQGYLGGPGDHPFGYRHWFYNVLTYKPWAAGRKVGPGTQVVKDQKGKLWEVKLGEDSKRCVAFYPQSTCAAIIKEAMLRLFDPEHESYIGDCWYGKTPLRAQVHDSLLLEVPEELAAWVIERVVREMRRPIPEMPLDHLGQPGEFLSIGVEVKQGYNWGEWDEREELVDKQTGTSSPNPGYNPRGMRKVKLEDHPATVAADSMVPVDIYDEEEDPDDLRMHAIEGMAGTDPSGGVAEATY